MTSEQPADNVTWLTVAEAAGRMGVSVQAVRKYIADGKLETREVDGEQHVLWIDDGNKMPLEARHSGDDPTWLVPSMMAAMIMLFVISAVILVYVAFLRPRF